MNIELYAALATILIVFLGMLALAWRALSIAHDLAKTVLQLPARAQAPVASTPSAEPVPKHPPGVEPPAVPPAGPITEELVVDEGLVNFIKKAEGFRAKPYWDYKQWTVGYGTRASGPSDTVTEAEAEQRLRKEIDAAYKLVVNKFPNVKFDKGQLQALTDLTFNAGSGWEEESLGKQVAAQKIDSIKADILLYNHAGGQVNAGLTARREAEVSWFDNPL